MLAKAFFFFFFQMGSQDEEAPNRSDTAPHGSTPSWCCSQCHFLSTNNPRCIVRTSRSRCRETKKNIQFEKCTECREKNSSPCIYFFLFHPLWLPAPKQNNFFKSKKKNFHSSRFSKRPAAPASWVCTYKNVREVIIQRGGNVNWSNTHGKLYENINEGRRNWNNFLPYREVWL
jgi:hypothetical protein